MAKTTYTLFGRPPKQSSQCCLAYRRGRRMKGGYLLVTCSDCGKESPKVPPIVIEASKMTPEEAEAFRKEFIKAYCGNQREPVFIYKAPNVPMTMQPISNG